MLERVFLHETPCSLSLFVSSFEEGEISSLVVVTITDDFTSVCRAVTKLFP